MLLSDIHSVLQWGLTIFILGIGFLPLTAVIFKNFFDRGYIFSKVLGLALTSYSIFLIGVFHISKFSQLSSVIAFCLLVAIFSLGVRRNFKALPGLKKIWKIFLFEELLFLTGLFFWA